MTQLDICVCTFQRDSVTDTICSLMAITAPVDVTVRLIVVDNDDTPSAEARVARAAEGGPFPLRYVHCPGRNISIARNAALEASDAPFLAFVDDDEVVPQDWLRALFSELRQSGAEVVIGPVDPVYPPGAPGWMETAGVHAIRPVWSGGEIRTGYSSNVLIDRTRPEIRALRFNLALGRSGGEDTDYFGRIHGMGGRISYAPDARVEEPVTPPRLTFGWLARRRYRMGQTHAHILLTQQGKSRWTAVPLATAKLGYCLLSALLTLPHTRLRNAALLRGCLHGGVVAGLMGHAPLELYGAGNLQNGRHT